MTLINLNEKHNASVSLALPGDWEEYSLAPAWPEDDGAPPRDRATSRHMQLNGRLLAIGSHGELPDLSPKLHPATPGDEQAEVSLAPLQFVFAVFPKAAAKACLKASGSTQYVSV